MTGKYLLLISLLGGGPILNAQAITTESKAADAQVGVGFISVQPDYLPETFRGVAAYADFDFRAHLGVEGEFHQANTSASDHAYERTYEAGVRYFRTYGPVVPYVKAMVGRGVFNYPGNSQNLGYDMFAAGGGIDYKIGKYLRLRGEYEIQKWTSFPNGGLAPQFFMFGVAYHFDGKPRYGH